MLPQETTKPVAIDLYVSYSDEDNDVEKDDVYKINTYAKMIEGTGEGDASFYKNSVLLDGGATDCPFQDELYAVEQQFKGNTRGYQSRCWCFTWNNYPEDFVEQLTMLPSVVYIIWGHETGKKKGTPHLQGFVVFESDRRFGKRMKNGKFHPCSLKGMIPGAFWKVMYSNAAACIKYCKKDGNYDYRGVEPVGQGTRCDLAAVCDKILSGEYNIAEVAKDHPQSFIRYAKGFVSLYSLVQEHRDERPRVFWFYGRSGKGKTGYAFRVHGRENVFMKQDASKFWDDYDQEPAVIINEFMPISESPQTGWQFQYLLQVIDRHKFTVEVKGSHMKFNSPCIYITSVHSPKHFYKDPDEIAQLSRRLDMIYCVIDEDTVEPQLDYEYYDIAKQRPCTFTTNLLEDAYRHCQGKVAKKCLARAKRLTAELPALPNYSDEDSVATRDS